MIEVIDFRVECKPNRNHSFYILITVDHTRIRRLYVEEHAEFYHHDRGRVLFSDEFGSSSKMKYFDLT